MRELISSEFSQKEGLEKKWCWEVLEKMNPMIIPYRNNGLLPVF